MFNCKFEIVHLLQKKIHKMKRKKNNLCPFVHPNILSLNVQGGSNVTGTDLYVNKPHCAAAV